MTQKLLAPIDEKRGIIDPQIHRIPLRCACGKCAMPFGYLVLTPNGYVILIESHHHGETHQNLIPLVNILHGAKGVTSRIVLDEEVGSDGNSADYPSRTEEISKRKP